MPDDGSIPPHLFRLRQPSPRITPPDSHEVYVFGLLAIGRSPCGRVVIALYDSRDQRPNRTRIGYRGGVWVR